MSFITKHCAIKDNFICDIVLIAENGDSEDVYNSLKDCRKNDNLQAS